MIDLKFIRENAELVKTAVFNKNEKADIDLIISIDEEWRTAQTKADELRAEKNSVSKQIGQLKKENKDASEVMEKMKAVAAEIKELEETEKQNKAKLEELLLTVPNIPHDSAPVGKTEADNIVRSEWKPEGFDFEQDFQWIDHVELGRKLDILDFERGAKISGSGFPLYKGKGATLERALINFFIDHHIANNGYTEVMPPLLVNEESMIGTGQLPKMKEDMYFIQEDGLYVIPTAEVPITNIHRKEILSEDQLPVKYAGYTPCFRREAGSYGKETKGFLRVHQFNKVELVKFVKPEESYNELELLRGDVERILQLLNIPYRVIELCTGDLSFAAAKCYDIETWSPAEKKWLEASSCSNFEDFQARRAQIKFRRKDQKKPEFVHTLNGSGLATSRLMVSLLENNQTPEGTIVIPKVLQKYTGFTIID